MSTISVLPKAQDTSLYHSADYIRMELFPYSSRLHSCVWCICVVPVCSIGNIDLLLNKHKLKEWICEFLKLWRTLLSSFYVHGRSTLKLSQAQECYLGTFSLSNLSNIYLAPIMSNAVWKVLQTIQKSRFRMTSCLLKWWMRSST